ncbi:MarR family transcriptional regulator [Paracrocinitomix mangrovi]|uniref:MarR family winged helix-turn-helix transcriptional regulator n=1 Tax=Paracrocinitomix mangrovi TaxID=2862509 RepID=UPI001C8D9768|nr:MarR family transcriptional regulator [Paracrocinitomix mangrovi]UKN00353.1 MarR family transcriptional regulator [Paracrocinitomix mangrovi]
MKNQEGILWLENQICFPIYATSRLITKLYTPMLNELDITYPQYLVLLVLWKEDKQKVTSISHQIKLETNTLTPLLQRMEAKGIISRKKSKTDERSIVVSLTQKGKKMEQKAACIPASIIEELSSETINSIEIKDLYHTLYKIIDTIEGHLSDKAS